MVFLTQKIHNNFSTKKEEIPKTLLTKKISFNNIKSRHIVNIFRKDDIYEKD